MAQLGEDGGLSAAGDRLDSEQVGPAGGDGGDPRALL